MVTTEAQLRALFIEHDIQVGTYDIDFAGHVSNISYLRWLEDMRTKLFEKYFPLKMFLDEGKTPVIASTNIQYRRSIRLFQRPRGVMWVSKVGNASMTIDAHIYVNGELTTTVSHVGVFIDLASGKPIRLPRLLLERVADADEVVPLI